MRAYYKKFPSLTWSCTSITEINDQLAPTDDVEIIGSSPCDLFRLNGGGLIAVPFNPNDDENDASINESLNVNAA